MDLQRYCLKIFFCEDSLDDHTVFIEIFQNWIRDHALPGIMIDVTDYLHVPQGPGVLLAGADGHISIDNTDGRRGLMYQRVSSHPASDLSDRILAGLGTLVQACHLVENAPQLGGAVRFDTSSLLFSSNDRLLLPNNDESYGQISAAFTKVRDAISSSDLCAMVQVKNDPRERFCVSLEPGSPVSIQEMATRVSSTDL